MHLWIPVLLELLVLASGGLIQNAHAGEFMYSQNGNRLNYSERFSRAKSAFRTTMFLHVSFAESFDAAWSCFSCQYLSLKVLTQCGRVSGCQYLSLKVMTQHGSVFACQYLSLKAVTQLGRSGRKTLMTGERQ